MRARWRRELDQQDAKTTAGLKCRYWPDHRKLGVECGKPATHSWKTVSRGVIPVCDNCVRGSHQLLRDASPLFECKGGCDTKLLSPGRCVSCFMDWVSPPARAL